VYCNPTPTTVVSNMFCSIPVLVLQSSPYSLTWGSSVYAMITATNVKGNSTSDAGNGAIIVTIPDAPLNLADDSAITSSS
jgi:hypothetical protein